MTKHERKEQRASLMGARTHLLALDTGLTHARIYAMAAGSEHGSVAAKRIERAQSELGLAMHELVEDLATESRQAEEAASKS